MSGSLRDELEKAFDEAEGTPQETPQEPAVEPKAEVQAEAQPTEEQKPGRTAGRLRDEHGRLLPGKAVRPEQAAEPKAPSAQPNAQAALEAPAAPKPPLQRPSSWKKEMWPLWEKLANGQPLTPEEARLKAEYILQRESDYAKGVSTYKGEWERAKPVLDALGPFIPALEANRIAPAEWIKSLGQAQQLLYYGNPQQKVSMISNLVRDYGIDLAQLANSLFELREGQLYARAQQPAQHQQPQQQPQDLRKTVQEMMAEERARAEAASMEADTKTYPHFSTVRETMVGLLQAGLAQDLKSAYDAALRMPQHSDIYEAQQQQQREAEAAKKAEEQRKAVEAARRNQVSPRSATPAGQARSPGKGLRGALESAFDEHAPGRV